MSCPICGRILCDHSPEERGQSPQQMMADYDGDEKSIHNSDGVGPATPFHPHSYNPRRSLPEHLRPSDWGWRD